MAMQRGGMATREHEQTLNVWLAGLLRERGLDARPEVMRSGNRRVDAGVEGEAEGARGGSLRVDVEVRIGPAIIAVECEHGQSPAKRAEAVGDADRRLEQGLAHGAVAVCYPDNTTEGSLPEARFIWAVRDAAGVAVGRGEDGGSGWRAVGEAGVGAQRAARDAAGVGTNWVEGSLEQLVSVIRLTPAQLGNPDYAAAALSNSLDEATRRLSDGQKRMLAQTLDLPAAKSGSEWNQAAKRALLVIATAVMFHSRLDSHLPEMRPELDSRENPPVPFAGAWPPRMAQQCLDAADAIGAFRDAWHLILALDYKPIFETGRAAVQACPPDPAFGDAVRDTARAALAVAENIAGLRHDLLGRIFHTVLDTARYDGSFYTTTAGATLLAGLALREDMCDWEDAAAIAGLRITDPACGTGTLLMAAAERIRHLAPQSETDGDISRALIERVFTGYDVNLTATHMAATTLGLLSPTTQFRNMKIGRTLLGVDGAGEARLGSLEFLDRQPTLMPWPNSAQSATQVDSGEGMTAAEGADLVIMNPPFTRDSLRHDQFSREDEGKIKAREKELFANKPVHLSNNGGPFLYLGEFLAKPDTGAMAVVLPLVGATNYATMGMRQYLAQRFHVDTIVTSHDPARIYFSENTDIGEMLVICRRWPTGKGAKPATRIVNLARNPATPAEAISVAWAVENGTVSSQGFGTVQECPADRIAAGDWGAVQFLSPYLCEKFIELRSGGLFPSVELGSIADVGPEGRRIRDAFTRSEMPDNLGRVALWQHDTEVTQSMAATWDTHIVAKPTKAHLADSYWQQRNALMLPQRMRLNTVRTLCARLDMPALGSLWVPCRFTIAEPGKDVLEKALCAYLNSSVGILSLLGNRTNKIPSYPHFSLDDLRKLMAPDFGAIGGDAASALASAYDAHAGDALLPLPEMEADPARRALDAAVVSALGLDGELVGMVRRSLAMEPSVRGRRYGG